ncbi:MAG: hypothetical protein A2X11_14390 [Bacteroidetes bacterium GWE2_42_24]|nr:MAG: hypothetical protein A2X11_14390 [Bacteroidetes bacterium GWE2_42_24]OFY31544.1 MAG: hypothetical protein A2X09_08130 [Bacteroidetes bacterium GWF2_43_11]
MRKLLIGSLLALIVLSVNSNLMAQKIGAKAGINISRISYSGDGDLVEMAKDNMAALTSTTFGIYLNYKLIPLLSLQIEGNYDPRGNKFDANYFGYLFPEAIKNSTSTISFDGEISEKLNYLTFPVLLKANLAFFHVEAGPYIGFLLNAKQITKGSATVDGQAVSYDKEVDSKDNFKSTDFGIAAGAGMTFNLGPAQLMAGARYMMGMTNILKESTGDATAKHQVITIYAGIAIGL